MKLPECMTSWPTDDESRTAARRLLDAGAHYPEVDMPVRLRRRPDGGAYIITVPGGLAGLAIVTSAALLDATERAERAEAALAAADALADAATAPADDDTQARSDAYRLARAATR